MKKQTKFLAGFILVLLLVGFLSSFVNAEATNTITPKDVGGNIISGTQNVVVNVLGPLFASSDGKLGKEWLTKIFFFILLTLLIWNIVGTLFDSQKKWISWAVSIIISILAIFFLPDSLLVAIRDQYGIMGATILSVIPFLIILLFSVRTGSRLTAQVTWVFYCFYYLGVYLYEWGTSGYNPFSTPSSWIYVAALAAGILMFFFIGAIRTAVFKGDMDAIEEAGAQVVERGKLLHKIQKKELEGYQAGAGI